MQSTDFIARLIAMPGSEDGNVHIKGEHYIQVNKSLKDTDIDDLDFVAKDTFAVSKLHLYNYVNPAHEKVEYHVENPWETSINKYSQPVVCLTPEAVIEAIENFKSSAV